VTRDRLTVTKEEAGLRLDRFLAARCRLRSRAYLQKLIQEGLVTQEARSLKASRSMVEGETIEVEIPDLRPLDLTPEAIPLAILYEDAHLIVIDKPAGIAVHPGAGQRTGTLVHALLHHCRDLSGIGGVERPGIVHRLDKGTSGVLVAAKSDAAHRGLVNQFQERAVAKVYEAVVWGRMEGVTGSIDLAIGRDLRNRVKISSRTSSPREAFTEYRVEETLSGFSWLEVKPRTGRTHQIRVHLTHLGHPIVGDAVYGGVGRARQIADPVKKEALGAFRRLALHARRLSFAHPVTGERLAIEAPLPPELLALINVLRRP
jgi:23S rRNA pseudouridine1911/1915/1917 synthase